MHRSRSLAVLLAAQGARAQAPVQLPSQIVEGDAVKQIASPKFTEPVLDVPQTIEVIPPEVYAAQGATTLSATLSDVLRNTPGITFFAGEGGSANRTGGDSVYLRGFDTSNSIFIDGVREEGAVVHDVFNIEQVEVVKGPSADNGRGGTAGYINLESKLPESSAFETAVISHGFSTQGSRDSDRAAAQFCRSRGGVPGRDYVENNRWGLAPSLAVGLGTPTRVHISYQHLYEHNLPDYGLPSTVMPGFAPPATSTTPSAYSPGVDVANHYGFVNFDYEHVTQDAVTGRA